MKKVRDLLPEWLQPSTGHRVRIRRSLLVRPYMQECNTPDDFQELRGSIGSQINGWNRLGTAG